MKLTSPNGRPVSDAALVGPDGKAVASTDFVRCPECGEGATSRSVVTFFGGWWKRLCNCGYVYEQGQGLAPLEE